MRQPPSAHRVPRWAVWFVLTLLTLAPFLLCQAVSSAEPAPVVSAAATAECEDGHDVLCTRGTAATLGASPRSGRDGAPELLVTLVVIAGVVRSAVPGSPSWAPPRSPSGRRQLLTLGVARI